MTLLSVVQSVTAVVGVQMPSSVFAAINSNRTMFEMLANANEMAQRIAYNTREWQALKSMVTFNGDGVTTAFNLPADYKRMLLKTDVWRSTSALQPMAFYPDLNEWMQRRRRNMPGPWGEWIIYGGQMHIEPVMGTGVTATFAYLNRNCINLASTVGGRGDLFMADGDSFVLDERLLKLGMIFNWKQQKGSPYAEDMGTYSDALQIEVGADSPAPIIIDSMPSSQFGPRTAYPWPAPSP
jgi:hypothetical protein